MWPLVELVGAAVLALAAAGLLSVAVALGVAWWVQRGHRAPLKGFSAFVLDFLYLPLKLALGAFGPVRGLDEKMVALKNRANHGRFARSRRRLLFAPQCLRDLECPAPSTRRGILCKRCGQCELGAILDEADRLGYHSFVLTGSSFIPRLVEEEKPDGALLIACPYECNKVMMALGRLATYAVCLDRDGCVSTEIAPAKAMQALRLGLSDEAQGDPSSRRQAVLLWE